MTSSIDFAAITRALSAATGSRYATSPVHRVAGGCINDCFQWQSSSGPRFVKLAAVARLSMFEAEAEGLRELGACGGVRVPGVVAVGSVERHAFLALEWLDAGATTETAQATLGERLASQHRATAREFGWHRDNTIGLTPQPNTRSADWAEFFRERRLRFQLQLAERNGFGSLLAERGGRLLEAVPALLSGHRPPPSLLHGDLWGGNWFTDASGSPVIFDPAVYYGDREADLAMTHLFGGFSARFYAAYEAGWPLEAGQGERRELYNLYHVLNHANLFGEGYARQAASMIDRLLAAASA